MKIKNKKFTYSRLFKPTKQDITEDVEKLNEYDRLGIRMMFGANSVYTSDELQGLKYLVSGKKLPKDLEQRLLLTREQRLSRFNSTEVQVPTDEEIEEIYGIKF